MPLNRPLTGALLLALAAASPFAWQGIQDYRDYRRFERRQAQTTAAVACVRSLVRPEQLQALMRDDPMGLRALVQERCIEGIPDMESIRERLRWGVP